MKTNQQIIEQGMLKFILFRGVIGWGIPTAIIFQFIMFFIENKPLLEGLISSLIIFPIVGIFFGLFQWQRMKAKFISK